MSGVDIYTPESAQTPIQATSPGMHVASNANSSSSIRLLGQDSLQLTRAHAFIAKDHMGLVAGMGFEEQRLVVDWLHQFWLFGFRTARTWGRGPRIWNSSNLRFDQVVQKIPPRSVDSPGMYFGSPGSQYNQESTRWAGKGAKIPKPDSLCRWSIHISENIRYERLCSPTAIDDGVIDLEDENTWRPWPQQATSSEFVQSLEENMENSYFSNIDIKDLPIDTSQIIKAVSRSPDQLFTEAFCFSVMARNTDLMESMFSQIIEKRSQFDLDGFFPLHLAASYLNGAKSCCGVFDLIVKEMATGETSIRKLYVNNLHHTVLDTLMIAILKAHTTCTPGMVDDAFKKESRFCGEEVDICGRFDADSDCVRQLQALGNHSIPPTWKHMFCHTSAQAITHCVGTLFTPHWAPDINTPSGLFTRRCRNETCGLKMQLKPLHTLVVTTVYLAQLGFKGETLFGTIACLLCLLGRGANPLLTADVSWKALQNDDYGQECSHMDLNPLELAQSIPESIVLKWDQARRTGWKVFCQVLQLSQEEWQSRETLTDREPAVDHFRNIYTEIVESANNDDDGNDIFSMVNEEVDKPEEDEEDKGDGEDGEDDEDDEYDEYAEDEEDEEMYMEEQHEAENGPNLPAMCPKHSEIPWQSNYFRKNKYLAQLWAGVQTELLTYRRIEEGDPWISENFNLMSVLNSLETATELQIGLVSKKMMKDFCRCGVFHEADDVVRPRTEEASRHYFSNLENWTRTTYLHQGTLWEDTY